MSQINLILNLLQDGQAHRTDEIVKKVYGEGLSLARVGARIWDLKKRGYAIRGWKDPKIKTLYWYQLIGSENAGFDVKAEYTARGAGLPVEQPRFVLSVGSTPTSATKCCPSKKLFGVCSQDCLKIKVQTLL